VSLNVDIAEAADTPYATAEEVPIVGAFMVPGIASDPAPLRWSEHSVGIDAGDTAAWAVKPYARQLRIAVSGADDVNLSWVDRNGGNVYWSDTIPASVALVGGSVIVDVPPQAVAVVVGSVGATSVQLEWRIGLV
jgi:hypothetical protein